MQAGEAYDVVMIVPAAIDALAERGRIVRGTRRDIASVRIGVGVREGDPVPDISTLDAFVAAWEPGGSTANRFELAAHATD